MRIYTQAIMFRLLLFGALGLLGAGALGLVNTGSLIKEVIGAMTVTVSSIKISIKSGKINLTIVFKISNPKTTALNFKSFTGTVMISGKNFGTISDSTPTVIKANGDTNITVNGIIISNQVPGLLLTLLSGGPPPIATLTGNIYIDDITTPINQSFPVSMNSTTVPATPTSSTSKTPTNSTTQTATNKTPGSTLTNLLQNELKNL